LQIVKFRSIYFINNVYLFISRLSANVLVIFYYLKLFIKFINIFLFIKLLNQTALKAGLVAGVKIL